MKSISLLCQIELFRKFTKSNDVITSVLVARAQRQYSSKPQAENSSTKEEKNDTEEPKKCEKSIKIAVIGVPNAGKSSFINHFVNRKVGKLFAFSVLSPINDRLFFLGLSNIPESAYHSYILQSNLHQK